MPSSTPSPSPLERFPDEVRAAHARFCASDDPAALQVVIEAAVRDFMPRRGTTARDLPLRDDLRLIEDLGFDSLAIAETVFFFEDLFKVSIKNEDLLALRTIGELRTYVAGRVAARQPPA